MTGPSRTVPDSVCAAAVDEARAAAVEVGGDDVGEHLGCEPVGRHVEGTAVDHFFTSLHPGYRGWRWVVTMARVPRAKVATVDEVALVPGPDAVLAPEWLPWSERVRPGDVGPGDLLHTPPDDPRLVPAYAAGDDGADPEWAEDPLLASVIREIGLGRVRVLSREGRTDAADRWYDGEAGPDTPIARQAPATCGTCGFYQPLAGVLGRVFGACCNRYATDDGRVVAADHGCGAHSEAVDQPALAQSEVPPPLVDDERLEYEITPS